MSVKIGHARIDENGKATGGAAGDQNGKELRVQDWYNAGWGFLARVKDGALAEKIAKACEDACTNEKIGYDQNQRNTLLNQAKKIGWDLAGITAACECDCSSLVSCCVQASGIQIWSGGNAPTTRTLKKVLEQTGAFEILTDAKYLTDWKLLERGDILCKPGSHTVVVLSDGVGQPVEKPAAEVKSTYDLPVLKKGDRGDTVEAAQVLLVLFCDKAGDQIAKSGGCDGIFGSGTKKALEVYQAENGLAVNGTCDGETWAKLLGLG